MAVLKNADTKMVRRVGVHRNSLLSKLFRKTYFNLIMKGLEFSTALDVGAGDGRFSKWAGPSHQVTSIDIHPQGSFIEKADFMKKGFTENSFDLVYCSHVIEHVSDFISFAEKLERVSKKYVVVICPLPSASFWDEPTHVRPFTPEALRRLFFRMKPVRVFDLNIPFFISSCVGVFEK